MPRFLCLCQYGHSRSAALVRILHSRGIEAVALGAGTSPSLIRDVAPMVDVIVVMQPHFADAVPVGHRSKVVTMDIGHDRWSNPYNQELLSLVERLAIEAGFIEAKQ